MLIDFADVLMINVFKLGRTYKALLEELRLGGNVFLMNPIDPESLIYRFAKQLEFGTATMQVASEAVRIVQRMNRDWMTTGRRPAGICGAALILAARMNNFRRTVREVVYVVKVTEITISQRLNEFGATESGELTVDQFRSVQLENAHDPPSFTRAREGRKPSRSIKRRPTETAADIEEDLTNINIAPSNATLQQQKRVDADGFAIPSLPIDPALIAAGIDRRPSMTSVENEFISGDGDNSSKPTKGRPKGSKARPLPQPTPDQIASEEALEDEMTAYLAKGSNMVESTTTPRKVVSESAVIDEAEFESDPEVSNCLLSPAEVEIKERIWVHENKDYLRTQQAKALKRALEESESRPGMHKPRKRRRGRLGDVAYLQGDGDEGDGRSTRASTPAEATRRMLERRGFSKKINYRLLESLFGEEGAGDAAKAEGESMSRSQSVTSRRSASIEPETLSRRARLATPSTRTNLPSSPVPTSVPARGVTEHPQQTRVTTDNAGQAATNENGAESAAADKTGYSDEEPDDGYDDEGDDDEDADGVDAAFSGHYGDYYDEGSDYYDSD
jgi:transcription factor IIIB subunit 2